MKKPGQRTRHVPQRSCVGCRQVLAKRELIRIVKTPEGIMIDPTGKLNGRGVYLHKQKACWVKGLKGALAHGLRSDISEGEMAALKAFADGLPEDEQDAT